MHVSRKGGAIQVQHKRRFAWVVPLESNVHASIAGKNSSNAVPSNGSKQVPAALIDLQKQHHSPRQANALVSAGKTLRGAIESHPSNTSTLPMCRNRVPHKHSCVPPLCPCYLLLIFTCKQSAATQMVLRQGRASGWQHTARGPY